MGLTSAPLVYIYIRPALASLNTSLEEAAWVVGSSWTRTIHRIVLVLAKPALLSAALIVFVTSLSEFAIPSVIGPVAHIDVIATQLVRLEQEGGSSINGAAVLGLFLMVPSIACLVISRRMLAGRDYATLGARGSSYKARAPAKARWVGFVICCLYCLVAIILPFSALAVGSLQPFLSADFDSGWTLANYSTLFDDVDISAAFVNTIELGVMAAVIGMMIAVVLARTSRPERSGPKRGWRYRAGQLIDFIATVPLAVPGLVFGVGILWMWISLPKGGGLYGTKWILLVAYIGLYIPFGMRSAVAGFYQLDGGLEDAARVVGARTGRILRSISLPLLAPAILAGGVVILYHSMRELAASLMLYTPGNGVLSIEVWQLNTNGTYPKLFALGIVYVALILILVGLGSSLASRFRRL